MAKIPNYILKKINQHNFFVQKAADLEEQIDEWYEKQLSKHEDIVSEILDEDFADIKCDTTATYISAENMIYNLDLIEN